MQFRCLRVAAVPRKVAGEIGWRRHPDLTQGGSPNSAAPFSARSAILRAPFATRPTARSLRMFDRFVRLTQARRALTAGRLEEALRLLEDPLLADARHSEQVRTKVLSGLVARAQARASAHDLAGAMSDVNLVLRWQPEYVAARAMLVDLSEARELEKREDSETRGVVQEIRALVEAGDLAAAEARLSAVSGRGISQTENAAVRKSIESRRAAAERLVERARAGVQAGETVPARDLIRQALALHRSTKGAAGLLREVVVAVGRAVAKSVRTDLEQGAAASACERVVREQAALPELGDCHEFRAARQRAKDALETSFCQQLKAGRIHEATASFAALDPRVQAVSLLGELADSMHHLHAGVTAADDPVAAAGHFEKAAERLEFPAVRAARDEARAAATAITLAVDGSRRRAALGDIEGARQCLDRALAKWPLARGLHDEMKQMDDGALERHNRLAAARRLAGEGKLREALAGALALASSDASGDEARRLRSEVQAKIDVVAAGVDQIKRAVHGRSSGSIEGVGHCIARLDELLKLQVDHPELTRLHQCLVVERRGLEIVRDAIATCREGAVAADLVEAAGELLEVRSGLLNADRLDARLLEFADAAAVRGEAASAKGHLRAAELCAEVLGRLRTVLAPVGRCADEITGRIQAARITAARAVERGRAALSARQFDAAESAFDVACRSAADDEAVRTLGRELESVRARMTEIDELKDMTTKRDFARAHEKLAILSPTPPSLRTKIFDLKRNLAQAQGLDGGFVLRVDEGGEFLVLRRDSISIGNLRDGRSDLVVLANISGQHARIQRKMSFHGGMEDRIAAVRGEVTVNRKSVREHRLSDGDEISLAGQLRLTYCVPSTRSLTSLVRVLGGFQVRGTDKVLLMKDRGRDGRIIIGRARDAHVPVPVDGPEVELYAGLDGQIRVRCDGAGSMDGRPFTGEHPVNAGAVVVCGDVSFVLLPLPPG